MLSANCFYGPFRVRLWISALVSIQASPGLLDEVNLAAVEVPLVDMLVYKRFDLLDGRAELFGDLLHTEHRLAVFVDVRGPRDKP